MVGRYAGSVVQLDYGELGEEKSVVLVEARPGRPARVETVAVPARRPLRRLEGTLEQLTARAAELVGPCILSVTVDTPEPTPGLADRVAALFGAADVLNVTERCAGSRTEVVTEEQVTTEEAELDDVFRAYLAEAGTQRASLTTVQGLFDRLLAAVDDDREPELPEAAVLDDPAA